ncbi:MAG: GIY-YIG nuclease family protein [Defluviicoccus sp.]|nr:GIY-YIG nuclease family protein [Defluviicoccus sp.]MDE0386721.1 GIY-YIG nuclease family protein [Defluviicoccus sp.]
MERPVLNPGPDTPGAYALILRLARDTRIDIRTLGRPMLPAGLYLYAGSARGPGGIRARVARHLRHPKARVWHIDRLTEAARVEEVIAFPGGRECAVAEFALAHGARVPIPRFGASDCRTCEAHLLAVDQSLIDALTPDTLDKESILAKTRK